MKDVHELDDYFGTLLNFDLPEHRLFINDFKQRVLRKNNTSSIHPDNKNGKKKVIKTVSQPNKNGVGGGTTKQKSPVAGDDVKSEATTTAVNTGTKKKTKYVNLYQNDGDFTEMILLKGRHRCDCQASKHKLISNCMKCGRIVCEQEGSGPCLFCGSLVCSDEETRVIESSTRKGDHLKRSLTEQQRPKGWEEALAQRNRLLEYDRTSEKRTTIIDDESDYFKANSVWLSDAERKKLAKLEEEVRDKKHSSRLNRKVTLDFAGRQIVEEPQISTEYEDEILEQIAKSCASNYKNKKLVYESPSTEALGDTIHPLHEGPIPIVSVFLFLGVCVTVTSNLHFIVHLSLIIPLRT